MSKKKKNNMEQCGTDTEKISTFYTSETETDVDSELLELLDKVCEYGESALADLDAYIEKHPTEEQYERPDVAILLKDFEAKHSLIFSMPADEAKHQTPTRKHRWGYRLMVIAAAIVVINALLTVALGSNPFELAAKWGEETFGFFHKSDFQASDDGNVIYYPDGSSQDRSGMGEYDHETYEPIPGTVDYTSPTIEIDPTAEPGSPENPILVDYDNPGNYPDTDVSALGLEKGPSIWDGYTETFRILNKNVLETAEAFGVTNKLFPTWMPDGFEQEYVEVIRWYEPDKVDQSNNFVNFFANYINGDRSFSVSSLPLYLAGGIEKDDRPIIVYKAGNIDYYIMHNLDCVTATAIVGECEVVFWGDVTVEEMKKIVDSIYWE